MPARPPVQLLHALAAIARGEMTERGDRYAAALEDGAPLTSISLKPNAPRRQADVAAAVNV